MRFFFSQIHQCADKFQTLGDQVKSCLKIFHQKNELQSIHFLPVHNTNMW